VPRDPSPPGFLRPRAAVPGADEEWISVSDLMSGLMVIFLFIAISYLRPAVEARNQARVAQEEAQAQRTVAEEQRDAAETARQSVRAIVVAFRDAEERLSLRLEEAFRDDLPRWGAEFDRAALTIRFRAPEVLFEQGRAQIRPVFRDILASFLPRYAAILAEFAEQIDEIKIEGHTSSEWTGTANPAEAYANNMALSQERTRAVLQFWLALPAAPDRLAWLRRTATANGMASSRPVLRADGAEDRERSRRVEFRVTTRARERVLQVLEEVR